MLRLALLPFVITGVLLTGLFFATADFGLDTFKSSVLHIQTQETVVQDGQVVRNNENNATYTGSSIVRFLLTNPVSSWMIGFLFYVIGIVGAAMLSIAVALVIVGFLTPLILQHLRERSYPEIEMKGYGNIFVTIWVTLKNILVTGLLFILLIPLYFIPVVNIVALNYPLYYLFRRLLEFDITSEMMDREEFEEIHYKERHRITLRMTVLYLLSLIPLMGLFIPVFYIIYLGNGYFKKLETMRTGVSDATETPPQGEAP
jgi:hypothetical protein